MDSNLHFRIILLAFCLVSLHIHHCCTKAVDQNTRGKRESGCCRDKKDGKEGPKGSNSDGCCQSDNEGHGDGGGCCQDNDNDGNNGGDCCKVDAGNGNAPQGRVNHDDPNDENYDPCRYNTSNVHSREIHFKVQSEEVKPDPPKVEILQEAMMKNLLGEKFIENVKTADENTLLFFSTMLAKLQSHMEHLKFQADEVRKDLHLKFQGFDNWAMHTDRVVDSAIAVVRKRVYEVQWACKKHSDYKSERLAD